MQVNYGPYTRYFLWSLVFGISLAILYDFLRFFRKVIKTNDFIINIQDIIFIIISGGGAVFTAYFFNNGELRVYGLMGSVLGFSAYRWIIGKRFVDFLYFLHSLLCKSIKFILHIVLFPFKLLVKTVGKPFIVTICVATQKAKTKIGRKFVKMSK